MNMFLVPMQLQMQLLGLAFQATTTVMQTQARMLRLSVPGTMLPVTLRAGCGGVVRS